MKKTDIFIVYGKIEVRYCDHNTPPELEMASTKLYVYISDLSM